MIKKKSSPTAIGDLLADFLKDAMPKTLGEEVKVFGAWNSAVGHEVARQAKPKALRNGILFVETQHPIWTAELNSRRHLIRKKLAEIIGQDLVKEIYFRQGRP